MGGRIKTLIDELVELRTRGNAALVPFIRAHLILQGIDPERYTTDSLDDARVVRRLEDMLHDFRNA
jgi:hypothetical protein